MEDAGLLIIRLVVGLLLAGHGTQKLFGWFGGYGVKGTGQWLESLGVKPGALMATLAGLAETVGGLLFAAGLWVETGAVLIVLVMLVALFKYHRPNGIWIDKNGFEYTLVLIVVAVGVALIGPGDYTIASVWSD